MFGPISNLTCIVSVWRIIHSGSDLDGHALFRQAGKSQRGDLFEIGNKEASCRMARTSIPKSEYSPLILLGAGKEEYTGVGGCSWSC